MSKPLELTVYPIWDDGFGTLYADKGDRTRPTSVGYMQVVKRLTEPELCAEYESARCDALVQYATGRCWQPLGYTWPMDPESIYDRAQTLLRFASNPHYSEA